MLATRLRAQMTQLTPTLLQIGRSERRRLRGSNKLITLNIEKNQALSGVEPTAPLYFPAYDLCRRPGGQIQLLCLLLPRLRVTGIADGVAYPSRRRLGHHRVAEVAVADDLMELPVGEVEEPSGFAVGVVLHALGAQHWVTEGDGDGRVRSAHLVAGRGRRILGAMKNGERTVGLAFKQLRPVFEPCRARHGLLRRGWIYGRNALELVERGVSQ